MSEDWLSEVAQRSRIELEALPKSAQPSWYREEQGNWDEDTRV